MSDLRDAGKLPLNGALEEARAIAREYADRERAALQAFPVSPAREALDLALDFVMERDR